MESDPQPAYRQRGGSIAEGSVKSEQTIANVQREHGEVQSDAIKIGGRIIRNIEVYFCQVRAFHDNLPFMPQTRHIERHFTASDTVRDIVIGMSDGLTVPFALAAGLSGAVNSSAIIITAGLAEIAAGSIAMGLGGYLAAKSDAEHYESERARERREVDTMPKEEMAEVEKVLRSYGLTKEEAAPIVKALSTRPRAWVDFMMRFELGLEKPDPKRALQSALTIAGAYIAGGLIPLSPYIALSSAKNALLVSVIVTLLALLVFGYVKGRFTGTTPIRSAIQTMLIGGLAATAAFAIARAIS